MMSNTGGTGQFASTGNQLVAQISTQYEKSADQKREIEKQIEIFGKLEEERKRIANEQDFLRSRIQILNAEYSMGLTHGQLWISHFAKSSCQRTGKVDETIKAFEGLKPVKIPEFLMEHSEPISKRMAFMGAPIPETEDADMEMDDSEGSMEKLDEVESMNEDSDNETIVSTPKPSSLSKNKTIVKVEKVATKVESNHIPTPKKVNKIIKSTPAKIIKTEAVLKSDVKTLEKYPPPPSVAENPEEFINKWPRAEHFIEPTGKMIVSQFGKKPRGIKFNKKNPQFFATSCDNGRIKLWNYARASKSASVAARFDPEMFGRACKPMAESIAWSPCGMHLAVAFRDKPTEGTTEPQVAILSPNLITDPTRNTLRVEKLNSNLHTKGLTCVEWLGADKLITCGQDHNVVLWRNPFDEHKRKIEIVHTMHTSEIRALSTLSLNSGCIFTGGNDGRVICYDVEQNRQMLRWSYPKDSNTNRMKISHIEEHPINQFLMMFSMVGPQNHRISIFDNRLCEPVITCEWKRPDVTKAFSTYITPCMNHDGAHIVCGSTGDKINIWDVRKQQCFLPTDEFTAHSGKVLKTTFDAYGDDVLFSLGVDKNLGIHTFTRK